MHQCVFGHYPNRTLRVTLVGVGGNGSKMLIGLKNLHLALSTLGLFRLHVTAYDHDLVSESNLVRQSYATLGRTKRSCWSTASTFPAVWRGKPRLEPTTTIRAILTPTC